MTAAKHRREERLEVRLSSDTKRLLQRAAAAQHKTISAFVLESGVSAAAEALADRRDFPVSARAYDAFLAALDAQPQPKPRLDELLRQPSVLE